MRQLLLSIFIAIGLLAAPAKADQLEDDNLYRITMLRAAPGEWYALKDIIEGQGEAGTMADNGRMVPYRLRHSQGDQWDFMLIQPIISMQAHFAPARQALEAPVRNAIAQHADFSEDWFVRGPSHGEAASEFARAGLYHLEMFKGRAGMVDALEDSRIRENGIFADIGMRTNSIWVGIMGSDYDVMTIGFHDSWASYAEHNAAGTDEEWATYSRKHGYEGGGDLAPQLRSFLTSHNDGFAVPMQ